MSNLDERDQLARELHDRSHDVGGHPIDLDGVKRSARRIQLRRRIATGAVAAAVFAVAVPTALAVTDGFDQGADPVSPPTPAVSKSAEPDRPTPTPRPDGTFPLTIRDLPRGDAAALSYVLADENLLVTPDREVEMPESYSMITPYNGGWLAVGSSRYPGDMVMLDSDMQVTRTAPGGFSLAVSQDGAQVVYTERQPSGETVLVNAPTDGSDVVTWTLPDAAGEAMEPVGFLDRDTVVFQTEIGEPMGIARTGGEITPVEGLLRIEDASEAGLISGQVSYDDTKGSGCSGVMDPGSGDLLWESCDHSRLTFSPDGRFVIAEPAYVEGLGAAELSVLDALTGEPVVTFSPERRGNTMVAASQAVWEDEDTILAIVSEGAEQAMVRLGLDGSIEAVTDTYALSDMAVELWFAETPR